MIQTRVAALLIAALLIASCASGGSETSNTSVPTTAASTTTESSTTAAEPTTSAAASSTAPETTVPEAETSSTTSTPTTTTSTVAPANVDACKLPLVAFTNVGLGIPRFDGLTPSVGKVRVAVLFVDFPDAFAVDVPDLVLDVIDPTAADFYDAVSYGRMELILEPHLEWLMLSQPAAHYQAGVASFFGHLDFIQEAVDLADAQVDFSEADMVLVMANPDASDLRVGPAFGSVDPSVGIVADGVVIPSGVTSATDLNFWGGHWLSHEMGHTMSLPDLYEYVDGDQHGFVGGFSLMGLVDGFAPELFAFERWTLGWLDDAQIVCHESGTQEVELEAIESVGGTKAVIIPTGITSAVVVESRRALGYDVALPEEGALVYLVDTGLQSGSGSVKVVSSVEPGVMFEHAPLAVGESITVDGVAVTVTASSAGGDTVEVSLVG